MEGMQNPYDVVGWTSDVVLVEHDPITFTGVVSLSILPPAPWRLWFVITTDTIGAVIAVWPFKQSSQYGITPGNNQRHILIHNASYPSAVQMGWYLSSTTDPTTVHMVEALWAPSKRRSDVH